MRETSSLRRAFRVNNFLLYGHVRRRPVGEALDFRVLVYRNLVSVLP
jgi:hypothetical protein